MSEKRYGFTTGSCAAAAAKAAAYMLLTGRQKENITVMTPKGIPFDAEILELQRKENTVSCAVQKDGGDDPDVTTGILVYARVSVKELWEDKEKGCKVEIDGGAGVGRVTKPGLDQPVGSAAINRVPREMIEREVREICSLTDFQGELSVEISIPGGEELARKTFNPRLGVEGGLSVLGTSGIVEPMSSQALLDTIFVELRQRRAMGAQSIAVSPGNYGQEYMKRAYGFALDRSIKCSNFIGDAIDMAAACGFRKMLLTGHIGKLVKLSGGMMNTHSREGDCRMELLAAAALRAGLEAVAAREILACVSTEEALTVLRKTERFEAVMKELMDKILFYLDKRAAGRMQIECIMYSGKYGSLATSGAAEKLLQEIMEEGA